ncbi:hypothetical protein J6590_067089 [Homalodisca vitripennis]|nr:hypothetical protein J6590_067089 [Homalodisca vitripennis]
MTPDTRSQVRDNVRFQTLLEEEVDLELNLTGESYDPINSRESQGMAVFFLTNCPLPFATALCNSGDLLRFLTFLAGINNMKLLSEVRRNNYLNYVQHYSTITAFSLVEQQLWCSSRWISSQSGVDLRNDETFRMDQVGDTDPLLLRSHEEGQVTLDEGYEGRRIALFQSLPVKGDMEKYSFMFRLRRAPPTQKTIFCSRRDLSIHPNIITFAVCDESP